MTGFVFVDGKYLPLPDTVVRRGNAIFINRIKIEQPVAWTYFERSDATAYQDPNALNEEDDFFESNNQGDLPTAVKVPGEVSCIDDLLANDAMDGDVASKDTATKTISSLDDLFDDDDSEMEKQVVNKQPMIVNSLDDLFGDTDEEDCGSADKNDSKPAATASRRTIVSKAPPVPQTAEQLAAKKEVLKKRLDEKRDTYERSIAKGELFFFGTSHNLVNGNYGSARAMLEVLPSALRHAQSPDDLMFRLKAGNLYFIDHSICQALYKHKRTFPLLQQRLDKIKQMEALKAARIKK